MVINKGYTIIVVQVKQMLRKAGERLRNIDENYAARIAKMYNSGETAGNPLTATLGMLLGGVPAQRLVNEGEVSSRLAQAAVEYGLPTISTAVRYGAPTVGVAAAYHGIQGLMPGEQTSGTVMPQ